jgi:hypothetical protein
MDVFTHFHTIQVAIWIPGPIEVDFQNQVSSSHYTPFHAAISVSTTQEKIEEIAIREGWLVRFCDRGPFQVVEFWVENKLMLELLPPILAAKYLEFANPQNFEAFFSQAELVEAMA